MTYEQAFQRLTEISNLLSSNELSLDKSMELFEESIKLSQFCLEQLKQSEGKILVYKGQLEQLKPLVVE